MKTKFKGEEINFVRDEERKIGKTEINLYGKGLIEIESGRE